ncbi:MAG: aldehyde dehydrogenase [Gaiellales bacterium]
MATQAEIEAIVRSVVSQVLDRPGAPPAAAGGGASGRLGQFDTAEDAVAAARQAQPDLVGPDGIGRRRRYIEAIRTAHVAAAEGLGRMAHEETGLGRVRDKVAKHVFAAEATVGVEDLARPLAMQGEFGISVEDWLPWGVVASVTPINSPSAFIVNHAITMIAGGNAVAFNVHPGCKRTSMRSVELTNRAIVEVGGPDNLCTGMLEPTLDTARALISHRDVDMVVVTGGAALVKDAFGTQKRVIAAGPGNPTAVVDETADLRRAAQEIFNGASYENTILCIGEKTCIASEKAYSELITSFADLPCQVLAADEVDRVFRAVIDTSGSHPRTRQEFVGRDAERLLEAAGLRAKKPVGLLVAPVDRDHPLVWMEQFCPFLPVVRARSADDAVDLGIQTEGGNGHTVMIHSHYRPRIERFARESGTVLTVVNGSSLRGLGVDGEGYPGFTIGTVTGEGITSTRHYVRARRVTHCE